MYLVVLLLSIPIFVYNFVLHFSNSNRKMDIYFYLLTLKNNLITAIALFFEIYSVIGSVVEFYYLIFITIGHTFC